MILPGEPGFDPAEYEADLVADANALQDELEETRMRLAAAKSDLASLRAKVEALAGEWERESTYLAHQGDNAGAEHYQNRAKALRALLPAPSLPPASTVECGANPAANSGGDDASRETKR